MKMFSINQFIGFLAQSIPSTQLILGDIYHTLQIEITNASSNPADIYDTPQINSDESLSSPLDTYIAY